MITVERIIQLLSSSRLDLCSEAATQRDIDTMLASEFPTNAVRREHRLGPADRPDFFLEGGIVIEVKAARQRFPAIHRQLTRYAAHEAVTAMILASNTATIMPPEINGKPVHVVNLGRAWL